jgi:dipeptidyl aminopeptidase/acylaminoacyl peptidase
MTNVTSSVVRLPFGSWPSPLAARDVAAAAPRIEGAAFVGADVWWGETVPEEGGRTTIRRRRAETVETLLPAPWSARSRVHEYGGGAWAATDDGHLVFVEKNDQRVWLMKPGGEPRPLTPDRPDWRFGGLRIQQGRLLAVREVAGETTAHAVVEIPLDGAATRSGDALRVLTSGTDFVAQPSLSPDGSRLAWVAWDHPDMPWDRAEIRVADVGSGPQPGRAVSPGSAAALQPEWVDDRVIRYSDDRTGFWNLFRVDVDHDAAPRAEFATDGDIGGPLWVLGSRWHGTLSDGRIVAVRSDGRDELVVVDPRTRRASPIVVPPVGAVLLEDVRGTSVLLSGAPADAPAGLWRIEVPADGEPEVTLVRGGRWADPRLASWVPRARRRRIEGRHGPVHAFEFPPTHPEVAGPEGEAPPYVVLVHGGPTAHSPGVPSPKTLYLTSRGIGVVEVNYGGSSGYGRAYRQRLRGQWGVVDVDDVIDTARALGEEGVADPRRIAVAGGSAGGWTVLGALTRSNVFAAGISRYGVADARLLAADTHDFESRYLDGLIGPLPESEPRYLERSPLTHVDKIAAPVLLLQGEDDAVVPPSQSEAIRDGLRARGIPHAYRVYPGEGHGFRRAETITDMVETEVAFLGAVFAFDPADGERLSLE